MAIRQLKWGVSIASRKDIKTLKEIFMNDDIANVAADMARVMNYKMHAKQLHVPMLKGLQIKNDGNPQTILLASGNGFVEQLISDGPIQDGDFEKRIDLVITKTKRFMKNNNYENVDNSFIYYKDYNNGIFNFKLYFQDMIIPADKEKKIIRALIAYFVEPKMHDFYQMSLSIGPFEMPTKLLKIGIIDLDNDQITHTLSDAMQNILDNLKYK